MTGTGALRRQSLRILPSDVHPARVRCSHVSAPVGELEVRCRVRGATFRGDNGVSAIWDRLEDGHFGTDYHVNTRGSDRFQEGIPRC